MTKLVLLDAETLGSDISLEPFRRLGDLTVYPLSRPEEIAERCAGQEVVFTNKCRITGEMLAKAPSVRLISLAATGYDNVDLPYCQSHGIAVVNVKGYSTDSVAQLTVTLVLALIMHLKEYSSYVQSGEYSMSGNFNLLTPPFRELRGKTWGIIGAGNIGHQVAAAASAFGCRVIVNRRSQDPAYPTVTLQELLKESDIISVHAPLNDATRGMIGEAEIAQMKDGVILVNVARGAITDEAAIAKAAAAGKFGGLGIDVYSKEPFPADHPFFAMKDLPNVILTPHMAWGAVEARNRLIDEMAENVRVFEAGGIRNRVDLQ